MVCVYIFDFKVGIPSNITSTRKTLYKHIEYAKMDVLYQLKDAEAKELVKDLENAGFNPKQLKDGSVKYK